MATTNIRVKCLCGGWVIVANTVLCFACGKRIGRCCAELAYAEKKRRRFSCPGECTADARAKGRASGVFKEVF